MRPTVEEAKQAVDTILRFIGEDPQREGLRETPRRVVSAMQEMTVGYQDDVSKILATTFSEQCDELVLLRDIPFSSLCEHHLLPFTGFAHVGYIPSNTVVGLSKLARLVHAYAKRLQIQERMTTEIANAINTTLSPVGVAVMIEAHHHCMSCRGVNTRGSTMTTSSMLGAFRDNPAARSEFLALVGKTL